MMPLACPRPPISLVDMPHGIGLLLFLFITARKQLVPRQGLVSLLHQAGQMEVGTIMQCNKAGGCRG